MVCWQSILSIVGSYFPEIKFCSAGTDEQALSNTSTSIKEMESKRTENRSKENSYLEDAVQNSGVMVRSCDPCLKICVGCASIFINGL